MILVSVRCMCVCGGGGGGGGGGGREWGGVGGGGGGGSVVAVRAGGGGGGDFPVWWSCVAAGSQVSFGADDIFSQCWYIILYWNNLFVIPFTL